ncbi:MAG: 4Fe-4S dicluster domain-containing protein [Planctomycetota bacterium]|jgi:NAD-dependent dihydropyrimidine dehydrogenase PreA subunit
MGHIVNAEREYRLLQQRLDREVTGAPDSPVFTQILETLFTPEEAGLARRMPGGVAPLEALAKKLKEEPAALQDTLTDMARRGLVLDFEFDCEHYYALAPVVIGFFEFTFMRTRERMPMTELAKLFDAYFNQDDRAHRAIFGGATQLGRALVHEETLPDHTEVLDWERATHVVESASAVAVSLCPCRHKPQHLGRACDRPLRTCLTFNHAADALVRSGIAEEISAAEAMGILEDCKSRGMMQTGDNVQRKLTYICNCCGCCCGMIEAMKACSLGRTIVSANWIMEVDDAACVGCGRCAEACPPGVIEMEPREGRRKKLAVRDAHLCLGCGVCYGACSKGAISMKPRARRSYTPETFFDRMVAMAIDRGKLADLLFSEREKLSHRALGRVVRAIERTSFFRRKMTAQSTRSAFIGFLAKGARASIGPLADVFA